MKTSNLIFATIGKGMSTGAQNYNIHYISVDGCTYTTVYTNYGEI